jgi:nitroimidazol reductase NimA-like FMN-containing flavoprotein (pyridoxamine 5'-phosphate oxidase superfamily)
MLINDMSVEECGQLLARVGFGRLACARDDQPYIVPIYFAYEPDHLYGFSTVGRKIDWMRSNPRVCVEADEVTDRFRWKSVIVTGRYEELPETPQYESERLQARMLIEKRYLWWQAAYAANQLRFGGKESAPPLFYCIHIDEITGRSAVPDPMESKVPL